MMETLDVAALAGDRRVVIGALVVSVLALIWVARRVRKLARSERPDEPLSNLAMLIGLGWSSEAIWELTGRIDGMPTQVRVLIFFVLEALLILAMIRAKRAMREHGHPGRSGRTAWIVAVVMALVAGFASNSFAEALLRIAIPLLVTNQWWDGLVGEGARKKSTGATSWRWTPRRLLLLLGAIEPGERDVETVHRERLTQTMTRLEFRRRHGSPRQQKSAARRLARLSLTADDEVIGDVRTRVDRATWFDSEKRDEPEAVPRRSILADVAASARARRVRHGKALRRVVVTNPRPVIAPAQEARQELRETQDIDFVTRVIKDAQPKLSGARIAHLIASSEPTVRRSLRRTQNPAPPPQVNGHKPEFEKASS